MLKKQLEAMGMSININKNIVKMDMNYNAICNLVNTSPETFKTALGHNMDAVKLNFSSRDKNRDMGKPLQGLRDDLNGKIDMEPYNRALNALDKTGFCKNLTDMIQHNVPKRKLKISEDRGDWSYERKDEDKTHVYMTKEPSTGRVLNIVAHFWVAGFTPQESIDKYGTAVWAISQAIEKAGLTTSITWRKLADGVVSEPNIKNYIDIRLKEPGEYIAPSFLAGCFTGTFYRRVSWSLHALAADLKNMRADTDRISQRSDLVPSAAASMVGNTLHITPDVAGYTSKVIAELEAFFNQDKKKTA